VFGWGAAGKQKGKGEIIQKDGIVTGSGGDSTNGGGRRTKREQLETTVRRDEENVTTLQTHWHKKKASECNRSEITQRNPRTEKGMRLGCFRKRLKRSCTRTGGKSSAINFTDLKRKEITNSRKGKGCTGDEQQPRKTPTGGKNTKKKHALEPLCCSLNKIKSHTLTWSTEHTFITSTRTKSRKKGGLNLGQEGGVAQAP